jgi:hypothetical protein
MGLWMLLDNTLAQGGSNHGVGMYTGDEVYANLNIALHCEALRGGRFINFARIWPDPALAEAFKQAGFYDGWVYISTMQPCDDPNPPAPAPLYVQTPIISTYVAPVSPVVHSPLAAPVTGKQGRTGWQKAGFIFISGIVAVLALGGLVLQLGLHEAIGIPMLVIASIISLYVDWKWYFRLGMLLFWIGTIVSQPTMTVLGLGLGYLIAMLVYPAWKAIRRR